MPLDVHEAGRTDGLQDLPGWHAGRDGVPAVAHEQARVATADECRDHGHEPVEPDLHEGTRHRPRRLGELEHAQAPAWSYDPVEFGERRGQIADVAKRVAHAEKVGAAVRGGNCFAVAAQQPQACRHPGVLEHARTRIHSSDARGITDDPRGGAGEQPRAGPDVEHTHSRLQARIPEGPPAVPGAGPQSDNALEAIVVGGRSIENAAHPCAALAFGAVVRAQWWMRCWHETQLTRACDCTPPAH